MEKRLAMSRIRRIRAREVLDSRGNPTIEVDVETHSGIGRASVPSGASTGAHEALELRDGGARFGGKGVLNAVKNVNDVIAKKLAGKKVTDQEKIDSEMLNLDGTPDKSRLGANAILGVSMAISRAAAVSEGIPLYRYLQKLSKSKKLVMPVPCMNIINGGRHAGNSLDVQEFLIMPTGAASFSEAVQIGAETYHVLKDVIKGKYGKNATNVGDEGGFAPPLKKISEAVSLIEEALRDSGYSDKVQLGIDCAASEFYNNFSYRLAGKEVSKKGLIEIYQDLVDKHNFVSIEDPFNQEEFEAFASLNAGLRGKAQVVGDDLLVTNARRIATAIEKSSCSCLLLKVNQIGTVTEAINAANLAMKSGWNVMVSHRSGETEDSFIADLAVALGCGQIKTGAPARGERTAKYNQLLRIEEELGSRAIYQGKII